VILQNARSPELAGNFGDEGTAVIGQSRNDRFDRMLSEILNQIGPVRGIQAEDAPILLTDALNPYLTHTINIHLKTISCAIKNLHVALHLEI